MNLWQIAEKMHDQMGLDYDLQLAYYKNKGYIYSSPTALVWAMANEDSWFIYIAVGKNALREFFECMPFYLPKYSYCRFLKNREEIRSYSIDRTSRLLGINLLNLKQRKRHG